MLCLRHFFCFALCWPALAAPFSAGDVDLNSLPTASEGFEITMFAREPLVRNPCSIAVDARGKLFVSMGPQYRNPKPDTPPDSVVIVHDDNGDGIADQTHTFATGFNCVQGLAWHGRDLWVANAPDLTIVRDLDGDDVADEYIKVFTDLGNIEHGLHGLNWAPDGRLYMSKGNSKGLAVKARLSAEPERLAPKPFRELWDVPGPPDAVDSPAPRFYRHDNYKAAYHDPRDDWGRMGGVLRCDDMGENLEIVARGLRNPYGLAFDHGFDWLGTDQDQNEGDRLFMPFYSADFGWSHRWSTHWTGENHLPTAPISGPVYLGSGTGVIFADAPNWPVSHRGVWIINDWLLKTTHVYRPVWDGALMKPQGGQWEDFITPGNSLYRPVDMAFGADGALYILGWGRGYGVEWDAKNQMTNEGRIYRIAPKGMKPLPAPSTTPLSQMSVAELQAEFDSLLPARRIHAQDELVSRGVAVREALMQGIKRSQAIETWSLWTLQRIGVEAAWFVQQSTHKGTSLNARLQCLRILGDMRSKAIPSAALRDAEPRIRFAAVQAIHQAGQAEAVDALIALLAEERDRITYYAAWHALRDLAGLERLRSLIKDQRGPVRCAALLSLLDLQAMPLTTLHEMADDPHEPTRRVALLGLGIGTKPDPKAAPAPSPALTLISKVQAESGRAYTTAILQPGQPSYTDRPFKFTTVPDTLRGALMIRTANDDDRAQGQRFLTFDLAMESTVIIAHDTRLKQRPAWLQSFSDTDQTLTSDDTTFHLWSQDFPAGEVVLGGNSDGSQRSGFANYVVIVQPRPLQPRSSLTTMEQALQALPGANPKRGEALFFLSAGCAGCHRIGDRGTNFGPNLTHLGDRMEGKFIMQAMLDPNAVITEGFAAHAVEAGGKSYFGTLLSSGRTLKLGLVGGQTVELASDSVTKHETLPVSPMPPQGALLGPQEVADISAWLLSQRAVPKGFHAEARDDRLIITHNGSPVAHFVFRDAKVLRPYFAHVHVPGGIQITRHHPPQAGVDPVDHGDMHPGLWLGFGDINGTDFWRNQGRIVHERFRQRPAVDDGVLRFATESSLLTASDQKLASLTSEFTLKDKQGAWHLTWDAVFTPVIDGFYFGDQEEMGLGVRVATAISEKKGGLITSSTGQTTAKQTWGQPAAWCDYSGIIKGRHVGVMIVPDPANAQASWWHNRDYGVFVSNPFGRQAMKQGALSRVGVKRGEVYRLRHTIILHASADDKAPELGRFLK